MRIPSFLALLTIVCASLLVATPQASAADLMGWYLPLHLGASWTYENADNPFDTFTETVFELIDYEGLPAFRFGTDINNHTILFRSGGVISVYAEVENGQLLDFEEDIVLGEVVDGSNFRVCFEASCDTSLIRIWENLDPALRSIYGLDPALTDLVLIASYDADYPPNLHNVVVESNLPGGVIPPAGAVTELEWFLRSVGSLEIWEVDAASGGLEDHYVLAEVSGVDNAAPRAGGVALEEIAPNPFNPRTTIRFRLAAPGFVTLSIHDCTGRLVKFLATGEPRAAGSHSVVFDGADTRERALPAGTYLCRITTGDGSAYAKLCLVR